MEFKTFFNILKNRISNGENVPEFMRYLISSITDIPEKNWDAPKDPNNRITDHTLRNYSKSKISKKLAQSIIYNLDSGNFKSEIDELSQDLKELLVNDFRSYEPSVNTFNISEIITNIFTDIIKNSAGLVSQDTLEKQKQLKASIDLKIKYGKFLLKECDNHCSMTGCGKLLFVSNEKNIDDVYEISHIDKNKGTTINNLIALCPQCFSIYQMDNRKKITKELIANKIILSNHFESIVDLNSVQLEKGLTDVILNLKKLKGEDLLPLTMNPIDISSKINKDNNFHLYTMVNNYVTTYFLKIREIFENLDKQKKIDYEDLSYQIKSAYKKLNKPNKTKFEIFKGLSEKIHKVTLQEEFFCDAITCYFIQSCEVFDAIPK